MLDGVWRRSCSPKLSQPEILPCQKKLEAEMPNIILRVVTAYHKLVDDFGDKDLTQHFPEDMVEWAGEVRAETSKLFQFLSLDEDERVIDGRMVRFERDGDSLVRRDEVAALYRAWADNKDFDYKDKKFTNDEAAFSHFGFLSPPKTQLCKHCLRRGEIKKHKKGCCSQYSSKDRTPHPIIEGMKIVYTPVDES